ncbi:SSU processome protein Utp24 [Ignicoccus pacificus DSM 13166]|uniref:SSU processome protein Utp24 n=1 Tax=Ignicoccus pacificus DSM 13166 TaxID=940294 RepID=A0A977K9C2_9CREN|nr:SSU processome protein Utp24 [Ignicoccus pacificus DSM 13166]
MTDKPRRYVLVDTSILLLLGEGIDVIDQLESFGCKCVVTRSVLRELEKHEKNGGKRGRSARLAKRIIEQRCFILETDLNYKRADDELCEIALRYGVPVATADMGLRRRLLRKVPTFYYRESQRRVMSDDYWD